MDAWRDFDDTLSEYISDNAQIVAARQRLKQKKLLADRRFVLFFCAILLVLGGVIGCRFTIYQQQREASQQAESGLVQIGSAEDSRIAVHVIGEVNSPGLYYFDYAARVADAIEAAGGATERAALEQINLAAYLTDAMQLVIPAQSSSSAAPGSGSTDSTAGAVVTAAPVSEQGSSRININTADAAELQQLNGIGQSRAAAIIAYREEHGNFASVGDIRLVSGIGDGIYNNIKDDICVE